MSSHSRRMILTRDAACRAALAFGVLMAIVFGVCVTWGGKAAATYKPEYAKNPPSVQEWFKSAQLTPQARARLFIAGCCEHADRLRTKFVPRSDGEWSFYPDPNCTAAGCQLLPIPSDTIHEDTIRAFDPKDDGLPEFDAMRREGVLFIWNGQVTCFWPPEPGI